MCVHRSSSKHHIKDSLIENTPEHICHTANVLHEIRCPHRRQKAEGFMLDRDGGIHAFFGSAVYVQAWAITLSHQNLISFGDLVVFLKYSAPWKFL